MAEKTPISGEIWVSTAEAAQATGYNRFYLTRLIKQVWEQPEAERPVRIQKEGVAYRVWLPDLVVYLEGHVERGGRGPQRRPETIPEAEPIWVSTAEASQITGYHPKYLTLLAQKNWNEAEDKRQIRVRSRSHRYELWLPDLLEYVYRENRKSPNRNHQPS